MNKKRYMFVGVLGIVILSILAIFMVEKCINEKENDAKKFAIEYAEVEKDNVFIYSDINEILNIMKNGTGVVYLGFPESKWCQKYVTILNEVAKENEIDKIYYYNIYNDIKNNTENYQKLISILDEYLQFDAENKKKIDIPNISFHIEGKIIGNISEKNIENDMENIQEYWTENKKAKLKNDLNIYMEEIFSYSNMCTQTQCQE